MKVVIVGAGPAGLAAARSAAECGASATLLDDNAAPGGQIWRGTKCNVPDRVELRLSTRAIALAAQEVICESERIGFDKLILATGARELFLPFPGWTLPGVFGAGGLQALVKSGFEVRGKRVVVAGTGPLLLAVAHHLQVRGALVLAVLEQTSWPHLQAFGRALGPKKWIEAAGLWKPKYSPDSYVLAAEGERRLRRIRYLRGSREESLDCDLLAIGYGLIPNTELAELAYGPVWCAGEMTGIGGVELAEVEGAIAGYSAVNRPDLACKLHRKRARGQRFAAALASAFALRPALRSLATPETVVCRCEDVSMRAIHSFATWREAKLQTRCGMGPCQGRVCGAALQFLKGWTPGSVRPPVVPAPVESLIYADSNQP